MSAMIPQIVISYVDEKGGKVAKAAFVNPSDALIFWNAMTDKRKPYYVMETPDGEQITEIAHTGYIEWGDNYSHASALTAERPLPPRESDRERAERYGWEFEPIKGGDLDDAT